MHVISFILIFFTIIISLAFIRAQDVNDFNKPLPVFRNILKLDSVEVYNALLSVASSTTIDLNHPATVFLIADTQGSSSLDTTLQSQLSTLQQQLPAASSKFSSVRIYLQLNTQRRSKTLATLEAEVDTMLNLYDDGSSISVEGIFVDHNFPSLNSSAAALQYDSEISSYIHNTKSKKMFYHPRSTDDYTTALEAKSSFIPEFLCFVDYIVVFDGSFSEFMTSKFSQRDFSLQEVFDSVAAYPEKFAVMISSGVTNSVEARTAILNSFTNAQVSLGFISIAAGSIQSLLPSLLQISTSAFILSSQQLRRSSYFQVYGYRIGQEYFAHNSSWAQYDLILNDEAKTRQALENLQRLGINSLSLHNLVHVLDDEARSKRLRNFMYRARKFYGIDEILVVPDTYTSSTWSNVATFNRNSAALAGGDNSNNENRTLWCFDGFISEIEMISGGELSDALNMINYMKNQGRPARRFRHIPFSYNTYVGMIDEGDIQTLVANKIDTIFTFSYAQNPSTAQSDIQTRTDWLLAATISSTYVSNPQYYAWTSVSPAFSTEGRGVSQAVEFYLGDWIYQNSPGALGKAEAIVTSAIKNTWTNQVGIFSGYLWYEYFFTSVYTAHARSLEPQPSTTAGPSIFGVTCPATPAPPTTTITTTTTTTTTSTSTTTTSTTTISTTTVAPALIETSDPACFVGGSCVATLIVILLLLLLLLLLLFCIYLRRKKKEKRQVVAASDRIQKEDEEELIGMNNRLSAVQNQSKHVNNKSRDFTSGGSAAAPRPRQQVVIPQQQQPNNNVESDSYFNFLRQPSGQQQQQHQQPKRSLNAQDKQFLLSKYDDI